MDYDDVERWVKRGVMVYHAGRWAVKHRDTVVPVGLACALTFSPILNVIGPDPETQTLVPPPATAMQVNSTATATTATWAHAIRANGTTIQL